MVWQTKLLVPVLMLGMAGVVDAKGTRKHHRQPAQSNEHLNLAVHAKKKTTLQHTFNGTIVSISGHNITISRRSRKNIAATTEIIHTTPRTAVQGAKTVADLAVGRNIRVTEYEGVATNINVVTKHHHKKKK